MDKKKNKTSLLDKLDTPEMRVRFAAMPEAQIGWMHTGRLNHVSFNPPVRTSVSAMRSLIDNIATKGFLSPVHVLRTCTCTHPLLCAHPVDVVDGNRRVEIAQKWQIPRMRCVVHLVGDPAALWADLNRSTREITSKEWLYVWMKTDKDLQGFVPDQIARDIDLCMKFLGYEKKNLQLLLDANDGNGVSPHVAHVVQFLYDALLGLKAKKKIKAVPARKHVMTWALKQRATKRLNQLRAANAHNPTVCEEKDIKNIFKKMQSNLPI